MPSKKQIVPRESALQLYKKLVKEQEQTNSKYSIREHSRSSEEEVMRVLEILSLLPTSFESSTCCISDENDTTIPPTTQNIKNPAPMRIPSPPQKQKMSPIKARVDKEEQRKRLTSSPYHHHDSGLLKNKRHKKTFQKCSSHCSTTINTTPPQRKQKTNQRIRRNDEYIWHPITIKTGQGENKKETIVKDVMKYYTNQYHHHRRRHRRDHVPNQSILVKVKKK
jgi:hypothetical protein